ncbi:MAG: hypothetical protein F4Y00_04090 [Bacteroidetes bacterium SB0662_bin_6]|nr:hypothetical protein [Bacteroidetes bacterium SB0668_bin_1]MYE04134.1 hypothetical protein [Bacteroidetes bacterium SB0662_bin_6]
MMRKSERAWTVCTAIAILWMVSGWTQTTPLSHEQAAEPTGDSLGVLIMAHGGGADWNKQVDASIAGLRDRLPVSLAFGMANPETLQASLDSLRNHGASTVAVVRLFISGDSFLHQTEFLFGLRSDPPEQAIMGHHLMDGSHLKPLKTDSRILLDRQGMMGSSEASRILLARANENTSSPEDTGVMLIAHGMGSEDDNNRVLGAMQDAAEALRSAGYGEVHVAALREDWAEPRAEAERHIRATVAEMAERRDHVVVIPYRISGFGPYGDVLDGLEYVPADGLLPHHLVTEWIASRATANFCSAGLASPLGSCAMP